jgi:hypothetical protein
MTDNLIEAVAQALAISWFGSGIDEWAVTEVRPDAIAVIRTAAPLILDMAADALEADAELCDCFARSEGECACGAWDDYKTAPVENMVALVRQLKERFQ